MTVAGGPDQTIGGRNFRFSSRDQLTVRVHERLRGVLDSGTEEHSRGLAEAARDGEQLGGRLADRAVDVVDEDEEVSRGG